VSHLPLGSVHHIRVSVTDVQRSLAFYTEVLGFQIALETPPPDDDEHHDVLADSLQGGVVMAHDGLLFGLRPVDDERAAAGDRFDPLRVGLDHLSFSVPARADLDAAVSVLDERGVDHGPIREIVPFGISLLAFFDPDGIALELTAPLSDSA
jgi:catechol 2,3-dioxygenase-like lactoylglutathione lyase family enzyme